MPTRLQTLLAEAQSLPEAEQDHLADLIDSFLADQEGADLLAPDELAHLDRVAAEPFGEADPARLEALFARRG
jgi:hypothetical protein